MRGPIVRAIGSTRAGIALVASTPTRRILALSMLRCSPPSYPPRPQMTESPNMLRPFSRLNAVLYAVRAGFAHYRFARRDHSTDPQISGIGLVVSSRAPTRDEMDTVGS